MYFSLSIFSTTGHVAIVAIYGYKGKKALTKPWKIWSFYHFCELLTPASMNILIFNLATLHIFNIWIDTKSMINDIIMASIIETKLYLALNFLEKEILCQQCNIVEKRVCILFYIHFHTILQVTSQYLKTSCCWLHKL